MADDDPNAAIARLSQVVEQAVRQALDTDEFRQAVDDVVRQALVEAGSDAANASVRKDILKAIGPAHRAIAEAAGLAEHGTPEPLRRVGQVQREIADQIEAAVRDEIRRALRGPE